MTGCRLGGMEMKFAMIIWENEPISSGELAKLGEKELKWKKSTAYTILKRLCEKGLFQNANGTVTSRISFAEFQARQSEWFVDEAFDGSLPEFVAAFCSRRRLKEKEIMELRKIIDAYKE